MPSRSWRGGKAWQWQLLASLRFALCNSAGNCGAAVAGAQPGFRVTERPASLTVQATTATDAPMTLDPRTVPLTTVKTAYLPRLPPAPLVDAEAPHMEFKTYSRSEWDGQRKALCIDGDWKRYGADAIDLGATLVLRAGLAQSVVGAGA